MPLQMAQDSAIDRRIESDLDCFLSELGWREFSYYLLYQEPSLVREPLQRKFNDFPWLNDATAIRAWQHGMTGYPLIDAGMRELWRTGYVHNRVRMVTGSFLVKNLRAHWHHGEDWFWDCLVDADLANNSASWQWIAGRGALLPRLQPCHPERTIRFRWRLYKTVRSGACEATK